MASQGTVQYTRVYIWAFNLRWVFFSNICPWLHAWLVPFRHFKWFYLKAVGRYNENKGPKIAFATFFGRYIYSWLAIKLFQKTLSQRIPPWLYSLQEILYTSFYACGKPYFPLGMPIAGNQLGSLSAWQIWIIKCEVNGYFSSTVNIGSLFSSALSHAPWGVRRFLRVPCGSSGHPPDGHDHHDVLVHYVTHLL